MKESAKERKLRLWKIRQEAEGYDVSGVHTLEEAERFFDDRKKRGHIDPEQLKDMPYAELKSLAAKMGISAKGSKEELIARISNAEVVIDTHDNEQRTEE